MSRVPLNSRSRGRTLWIALWLGVSAESLEGQELVTTKPPQRRMEGPSQLRIVELQCGSATLLCEVADNETTRARGLMFRQDLPRGRGMLFVFPSPGPLSFWMKHTAIPLSIAYLDTQGVIQELHDLIPHREEPVASRSANLLYAIEVPRGWWKEVGVRVGDSVNGLTALGRPAR